MAKTICFWNEHTPCNGTRWFRRVSQSRWVWYHSVNKNKHWPGLKKRAGHFPHSSYLQWPDKVCFLRGCCGRRRRRFFFVFDTLTDWLSVGYSRGRRGAGTAVLVPWVHLLAVWFGSLLRGGGPPGGKRSIRCKTILGHRVPQLFLAPRYRSRGPLWRWCPLPVSALSNHL